MTDDEREDLLWYFDTHLVQIDSKAEAEYNQMSLFQKRRWANRTSQVVTGVERWL